MGALFVAWKQLAFNRVKLAVAVAGVTVAVMLILVQLGIRQGAMDSTLAIARKIDADLVVCGPRTKTIFQPTTFPRSLLYRLPAHPDVDRVREVYMGQARFRNPWEFKDYPIQVYGLDPEDPMLEFEGIERLAEPMRLRDHVVFDALSRTNFGPVVKTVAEQGSLPAEINMRETKVVATIPVGIAIATDGNMFVNHGNFLRLFPFRRPGAIDLGLVRLRPGVDRRKVRDELAPLLGREARIVEKDDLYNEEVAYMRANHPIDFIFGMGAVVGFFVGFVVVYQILYTEVVNHLPQFATLKAIGYTDGFLLRVVLTQGAVLAILGYVPGFILALGLYQVATSAIQMPFSMTVSRAVFVFALTLLMCGLSAAAAVSKVRTADPASVF